MAVQDLAVWLSDSHANTFPYDRVLEELHREGKHFASKELLAALATVRACLSEVPGSVAEVRMLERFLHAALDKWDGRYDYLSYLALSLLPIPAAVDELDQYVVTAQRQRDRLLAQLVADLLRFELDTAEGNVAMLPKMRPDDWTRSKRCRLGLRATRPALKRLGTDSQVTADDPVTAARQLCTAVDADLTPLEHRTLRLSMLPVYVLHDEYLFLRVLQSFETTFALIAVLLRDAVTALTTGETALAPRRIREAGAAFREAAPLFSLLATMQIESFRTFRTYTEGASAIQSRNYKIVEALCRAPDQRRLGSAAYHSVPEIRVRVIAGIATLEDAFHATRAAGRLTSTQRDDLVTEMRRFAGTLTRWRQAHYSIAVRMLGEHTGTGYTEGTPYLREWRDAPVFRSLDPIGEDQNAGS